MSSRPAIIRQRDVTRIVKGYAAAGITTGVVVTNGEVRILPIDQIQPGAEPSALERFRAKRHASKAGGHS